MSLPPQVRKAALDAIGQWPIAPHGTITANSKDEQDGEQAGNMTRREARASTAAEAVRRAIERKKTQRPDDLKPIEIVKAALCAYQSFRDKREDAQAMPARPRRLRSPIAESDDRASLRHGKESAVDRLLFNVNYWRGAYEDRIVAACENADDARELLAGISAWNSHTMRLNRLSPEETQHMFERFCPPFAENRRRGNSGRAKAGKGPLSDFAKAAREVAGREGPEAARALGSIVRDAEEEAAVYAGLETLPTLEALYELLPVWCLQDRIELVRGSWWEDADVMEEIGASLHRRFVETGYPAPICGYFLDSFEEALDGYTQNVSTSWGKWNARSAGELLALVREGRGSQSDAKGDFEVDGYSHGLPSWLAPKEQLIWNTIVCAIYGPDHARPFLPETVMSMAEGSSDKLDVITDIARSAYGDYVLSLHSLGEPADYEHFEDQPADLRDSMLAQVESFHDKLAVLGYHIVPSASCYPEQRIGELTTSEVECLAVLEHRRWLSEREGAGWTRGPVKSIEDKQTPYLVPWEELPERAREHNRRAVRNIPSLLASVGLAISR